MTAWVEGRCGNLDVDLVCCFSVMAADELNGTYLGIDDARGASIQNRSGRRCGFRGTFYDSSGNSQRFSADRTDDTAEAVLGMDGRTILLRMVPLPFGAEVAIIPFDNQWQTAVGIVAAAEFRARRCQAARPACRIHTQHPVLPVRTIAANAFLSSYQFWEPAGVVNGYLALPERFPPLMRMFPCGTA